MIGNHNKSSIFKIEGFDEIQEIFNVCRVPDTGHKETKKESHDRRNENRVNAKLAKIAGISRDKVDKYKAIKKLGTVEDILEVKEGKKKINPTYEELKLKHRAEEARQEFPKEKYHVIYADLILMGWKSRL